MLIAIAMIRPPHGSNGHDTARNETGHDGGPDAAVRLTSDGLQRMNTYWRAGTYWVAGMVKPEINQWSWS